jgi:hypothetical protein
MEEGDNFPVAKEARDRIGRLGKVGDHRSSSIHAITLRLKSEHSRMAILSDTRV